MLITMVIKATDASGARIQIIGGDDPNETISTAVTHVTTTTFTATYTQPGNECGPEMSLLPGNALTILVRRRNGHIVASGILEITDHVELVAVCLHHMCIEVIGSELHKTIVMQSEAVVI